MHAQPCSLLLLELCPLVLCVVPSGVVLGHGGLCFRGASLPLKGTGRGDGLGSSSPSAVSRSLVSGAPTRGFDCGALVRSVNIPDRSMRVNARVVLQLSPGFHALFAKEREKVDGEEYEPH